MIFIYRFALKHHARALGSNVPIVSSKKRENITDQAVLFSLFLYFSPWCTDATKMAFDPYFSAFALLPISLITRIAAAKSAMADTQVMLRQSALPSPAVMPAIR